MFSMGIDLEQPSKEYCKEDRISNTKGGRDRRKGIAERRNIAENDEDTRPTVSGRVFDRRHKVYTGNGINLNTPKASEPHDGMEFESKEEAYSFYKDYAISVGFSTIIKASRRSRISGKFIDAKFVCTRYGTKREDSLSEIPYPVIDTDGATVVPVKKKRGRINRSWLKTDCKACMHVKRRKQDGRWVVLTFVKEHNHEIFLDQAYYFQGRRNLDLGNSSVDQLHGIRGRTRNVFVSLSRPSCGPKKNQNQKSVATNQSGCSEYLALEEGDAQLMLDHFTCKQDENPNFFYAIDLNVEQQLRNVFWVDAKARLDYGYFGDVIFFDTSFIKNEYKLPFVPFIGVNHHFQGLLLGCALVASGAKLTYVWLLRAWLRAMGGHAPQVILTDQDKCLKEAIAEVFPNSHHCFCLWHILSKIPENLNYVIKQHENFTSKFNKCILKSCTIEQFEKRWWKITERFNLRNDVWFLSLYEDRERWIPVYMRDKFLAGISTTQRSESVSSFLDKQLQRKSTLKEFLEQQQAILQEKFEDEAKAEFETWHKQPGLKSPSPFGKQMASIYTRAIFKKFQIEVLGVVACHPRKECEDGETRTFKVQDFEGNQDFVVFWNETASHFSCSCHSFEFNGYLCRHVLIVMQMSGVHNIPYHYILKRWTKDAKSRASTREQSNKSDSRVQRYNDICRRALKLGDEGSLTQESYNIAFSALEAALRKCESVNSSFQYIIDPASPSSSRPRQYEDTNHANKTDRKDVSKNQQVQSEPEIITIGMHESWQQLGHSNLRASVHDCSYEMQESMQGMEQLNSRASNLDAYFGSQQIVRQLNSLGSSRDDYYNNQHGLQRLGQLNAILPVHDPHYLNQQRMLDMDQSTAASKQLHSKHLSH